jgi:hypothetical protein
MLISCELNFEVIKNSFLLYKKVTAQYQDPRVLGQVKELIPENVKWDLVSLLKWFKSFMRWMPNQLVCNNCSPSKNNPDKIEFMQVKVMSADSKLVRKMEVHTCNKCGTTQVFPRHNDVLEIAKTRTGRCGEWTILFGAILTSVSIQTRIVHDYLDHCWNEALVDGKWIHADSTLDYPTSLDHPHYYEQNWKKNYLYVLAFTSDKIEDVTQRYTEHWNNILARRQSLFRSFEHITAITDLKNLYSTDTL